jgi:hypothetical protein
MVRPKLHRSLRKQALYIFQQQFVLEDAAGENNGIQFMTVTGYGQGIPQTLSNTPLKRTCNVPDVAALSPVQRHG